MLLLYEGKNEYELNGGSAVFVSRCKNQDLMLRNGYSTRPYGRGLFFFVQSVYKLQLDRNVPKICVK